MASAKLVGCQMAPTYSTVGCQITPAKPATGTIVGCQVAPAKASDWNTIPSKASKKAHIELKIPAVSTEFLKTISSKIYSNKNGQLCLPFTVGIHMSQLKSIYQDEIYKAQIVETCDGCSVFFSAEAKPADNRISFVTKNVVTGTAKTKLAKDTLIHAVSLFHKLNEDIKFAANVKIQRVEYLPFSSDLVKSNLSLFMNFCSDIRSIKFVSVKLSLLVRSDFTGIECKGPDYQVEEAMAQVKSGYEKLCLTLLKPQAEAVAKTVDVQPDKVESKSKGPTVSPDFIKLISSKIYSNKNGQLCVPFVVGHRLQQLQRLYDDPVCRPQIQQRCGECSFFFSGETDSDDATQNKISFVVKNTVTDKQLAKDTLLSAVSLFHRLNEDLKVQTRRQTHTVGCVSFCKDLVKKHLNIFLDFCSGLRSIDFVSVTVSLAIQSDFTGVQCRGPDYQVDEALQQIQSKYQKLLSTLTRIKPKEKNVVVVKEEDYLVSLGKAEFSPEQLDRLVQSNVVLVQVEVDEDGHALPGTETVVYDYDNDNDLTDGEIDDNDDDVMHLWDNHQVPLESKVDRQIGMSQSQLRKCKSVDVEQQLRLSELQYYGIVTKCCGSARHRIKVISQNHSESGKTVMGRETNGIRNKHKHRKKRTGGQGGHGRVVLLSVGDVVVFSERGFGDDKVDILSRVDRRVMKSLLQLDLIVRNYDSGVGVVEEYSGDCGFDFVEDYYDMDMVVMEIDNI